MNTNALLALITSAALLTGCATSQPQPGGGEAYDKTKKGALIGAAVGALGGMLISKNNKGKGALIGAAIGSAAGAGIGYSLDKQAQELASSLDTVVSDSDISPNDVVVTKQQNRVKVTFKSAMMFPTASDVPTATANTKISKMAQVISKYPSVVQIAGHTDNRGSHEYNEDLSNRRAGSVAQSMVNLGMKNQIYVRGCSYDKPLVPNTTAANMAQNRRVEIFLYQKAEDVVDPCL
jgi:outer membrane protein OmpA-like peptidoglycan-associated protein